MHAGHMTRDWQCDAGDCSEPKLDPGSTSDNSVVFVVVGWQKHAGWMEDAACLIWSLPNVTTALFVLDQLSRNLRPSIFAECCKQRVNFFFCFTCRILFWIKNWPYTIPFMSRIINKDVHMGIISRITLKMHKNIIRMKRLTASEITCRMLNLPLLHPWTATDNSQM